MVPKIWFQKFCEIKNFDLPSSIPPTLNTESVIITFWKRWGNEIYYMSLENRQSPFAWVSDSWCPTSSQYSWTGKTTTFLFFFKTFVRKSGIWQCWSFDRSLIKVEYQSSNPWHNRNYHIPKHIWLSTERYFTIAFMINR